VHHGLVLEVRRRRSHVQRCHPSDYCKSICSALRCGIKKKQCELHCNLRFETVKGFMDEHCDNCVVESALTQLQDSQDEARPELALASVGSGDACDKVAVCKKVCIAIEGFKWWALVTCERSCQKNFQQVGGVLMDYCAHGAC